MQIEQVSEQYLDLRELGLVSKVPLDIDVINNQEGFGIYTKDIPGHTLTFYDSHTVSNIYPIHESEYDPSNTHYTNYQYIDSSVINYPMYVRIREKQEDGTYGEWTKAELVETEIAQNINPPAALKKKGFDYYNGVTWFDGLEQDKEYQVQMWIDVDRNAELNSRERWERFADDLTTERDESEYLYYVEADIYSAIHTLNTDIEDFNIDINADGTMDFFIS